MNVTLKGLESERSSAYTLLEYVGFAEGIACIEESPGLGKINSELLTLMRKSRGEKENLKSQKTVTLIFVLVARSPE